LAFPVAANLSVYTPTCSGRPVIWLCDSGGGKLPESDVFLIMFTDAASETVACEAKEDCLVCSPNNESLEFTVGKEVLLYFLASPAVEDLGGLTLGVTCE
jgi:hypothetical protein